MNIINYLNDICDHRICSKKMNIFTIFIPQGEKAKYIYMYFCFKIPIYPDFVANISGAAFMTDTNFSHPAEFSTD